MTWPPPRERSSRASRHIRCRFGGRFLAGLPWIASAVATPGEELPGPHASSLPFSGQIPGWPSLEYSPPSQLRRRCSRGFRQLMRRGAMRTRFDTALRLLLAGVPLATVARGGLSIRPWGDAFQVAWTIEPLRTRRAGFSALPPTAREGFPRARVVGQDGRMHQSTPPHSDDSKT